MDLYFVDRGVTRRHPQAPSGGASAAALLDRRGLPDGMPVALDREMRPVEPWCSWFRNLADEGKQPNTMRTYAYIASRLEDFLADRRSDLVSATETDLIAYRRHRTEWQAEPIADSTWDREAAVINGLFGWLVERGFLRRRPLRLPKRYGSGMTRQMQVRHLSLEQYLFFRDVGMGGQRPDGEVDLAFRGWCPHRNRAAVELALMTGMRKREWSSVLLPELASGEPRLGAPARFWLQACAKYGRQREVYVPAAALELIDTYVLLERNELVARAAGTLARRHRELFVVDEVDSVRGRLGGTWQGRRRVFRVERMPEQLRRITVTETSQGLESLAVFVGQGGLMLGPSSWDRIRLHAWHRMREVADHARAPALPGRPWRFHDLRHTFALRLLQHLTRVAVEREIARTSDPRPMVTLGEHMSVNPLVKVQQHLGHASRKTTYVYLAYLQDPMSYVDAAFEQWAEADGATYADIALHLLEKDTDAKAG